VTLPPSFLFLPTHPPIQQHYPDSRTAAEKYEAEKARRGFPPEKTMLEGIVAQNAQILCIYSSYYI